MSDEKLVVGDLLLKNCNFLYPSNKIKSHFSNDLDKVADNCYDKQKKYRRYNNAFTDFYLGFIHPVYSDITTIHYFFVIHYFFNSA